MKYLIIENGQVFLDLRNLKKAEKALTLLQKKIF